MPHGLDGKVAVVTGGGFIALHELFDKINENVQDYVDDIAERAVQLGCRTDVTQTQEKDCVTIQCSTIQTQRKRAPHPG